MIGNMNAWKKKINVWVTSKYFFIFLISFVVAYCVSVSYHFVQQRQNSIAFPVLLDLFERYKGALTSTSFIPFEELHKDIIDAKKNLGFFCNLHEQFVLLESVVLFHIGKNDQVLSIFKSYIPKKTVEHEIYFLYQLLRAIILATEDDNNKKQEGLLLLEEYGKNSKYRDVVLFYHGYLLRKTASLKQADAVWAPLKLDPVFNGSPYKQMVERVRNCDY
jgi:hypothetical protein